MTDEIDYKSNPLHGVSLKTMLTELVDQYGFELLNAYLPLNCFSTNPSIASSVRFLNKTAWARESVENFYLYQYKNLPKASAEQFLLPPRDRVIPPGQVPGQPAQLSFEDAEKLRAKRAKKAENFRGRPNRTTGAQRAKPSFQRAGGAKDIEGTGARQPAAPSGSPIWGNADPWANSRK